VEQLRELARRLFGITRAEQATRAWKNALWLLIGVGAVVLLAWAERQPNPQAAFGGGALVGAASATVGALAGMVFGLPRSAQTPAARVVNTTVGSNPGAQDGADKSANPEALGASPRPATDEHVVVIPNSNLVEISDWVTKIVVGLGLTQLGSLPGDFQRLVDYSRAAVGTTDTGTGVVAALIVTYFGAGFILSYLASRTDLECAMAAVGVSTKVQLDMLERLHALELEGAVTAVDIERLKGRLIEALEREIP
jgi:hypothetical protein